MEAPAPAEAAGCEELGGCLPDPTQTRGVGVSRVRAEGAPAFASAAAASGLPVSRAPGGGWEDGLCARTER